METEGLQNVSAPRLGTSVGKELFDSMHSPSKYFVRKVLTEDMQLEFRNFEPKGSLTGSHELSGRRLWVSRLLTMTLLEGTLLLSVDEAALQLDTYKRQQWQPKEGKLVFEEGEFHIRGAAETSFSLRSQKVPGKQARITIISALSSEGHIYN